MTFDLGKMYSSSLDLFDDASDETAVNVTLLTQLICKMDSDGPIDWLDIGSGDLKKIRLTVAKLPSSFKLRIECVEPRPNIAMIGTDERFNPTIYKKRWPDASALLRHSKYAVITLVHSLYQFDLDQSGLVAGLDKVGGLVGPDGIVIIIHEGPRSALRRVKEKIYGEIGAPLVDFKRIESTARALRWPDPMRLDTPQRFYVKKDDIADVSGSPGRMFPWFIFDTARTKSYDIPAPVAARAAKLLQEEMLWDGDRSFLTVDDIVYEYLFKDST